ncbi:MAG: HutD family protein [Bacteroidetes bacterium]|nr:HutD family protein [Bacteroidota bacterium]MBS1559639.1 HutD family protein [Bacteroidota bacterium]
MALLLTPAHKQNTTRWSGGTTTQLCIYPYSATYSGRDFIFRISTATIESEESVFTKLPGYNRILMVLKGNLTLTHAGQHNKSMQPFDTDSFKGEWNTASKGKAVDLNVMVSDKVSAVISILKQPASLVSLNQTDDFIAGYIREGGVTLQSSDAATPPLQKYDFFLWEKDGLPPPSLLLAKDSILILIRINLKP